MFHNKKAKKLNRAFTFKILFDLNITQNINRNSFF
jgi:hypothetical protein